jgi:hypothetical protein
MALFMVASSLKAKLFSFSFLVFYFPFALNSITTATLFDVGCFKAI